MVCLLGVDMSYVKDCHESIRKLYPESYKKINDMAFEAGGKLWVNIAHPSPLSSTMNTWASSDDASNVSAKKRMLVEEAIEQFFD